MAIEIKELHIKGTVNGKKEKIERSVSLREVEEMIARERSIILKEVVDQVMELLKEKERR